MSFLLEARARMTKILWMWRLSPTRCRHYKQNPSQIQGFDIAVLSCTSESFKRKKTRRCSMATRLLEINGRHERSTQTKSSILIEWQNDEQYRTRQNGQRETYFKYFDYLTTIDTSQNAHYAQRNRYENTTKMKSNVPNHQSGPNRATTKALISLC